MGSNQVNSMYSFTSDEYNSLRNELIARIEAFNNQSTTAITTILTALASAIALLVLSFSNGISDRHIIMGFDIAQAIALLTPVLFLFPISLRSGEILFKSHHFHVIFVCSMKNGQIVPTQFLRGKELIMQSVP